MPRYEYDSDLTISSSFTLASTQDGEPVHLVVNGNLTVPSGLTLTPTNRCKGLFIHVLGDLVVDGTISMTARGADVAGQYVCINYDTWDISLSDIDEFTGIIPEDKMALLTPFGGSGDGGENIANKGGRGTSFSGGSGAGGAGSNSHGLVPTGDTGTGGKGGGTGGSTVAFYSGGGAGNPGGTGSSSNGTVLNATRGTAGTGGLLVLCVQGRILIGNTGSIQSKGSKGGNAYRNTSSSVATAYACGGCGSGGGIIFILCHDINNLQNISVAGGSAGTHVLNASANPVLPNDSNGYDGTLIIKETKENILGTLKDDVSNSLYPNTSLDQLHFSNPELKEQLEELANKSSGHVLISSTQLSMGEWIKDTSTNIYHLSLFNLPLIPPDKEEEWFNIFDISGLDLDIAVMIDISGIMYKNGIQIPLNKQGVKFAYNNESKQIRLYTDDLSCIGDKVDLYLQFILNE